MKTFICGKSYENKNEMMRHRKRSHSGIIRPWNQFSQNKCRFKDEECWFKHEVNVGSEETNKNIEEVLNDDNMDTVFRKVTEDLDPPIN